MRCLERQGNTTQQRNTTQLAMHIYACPEVYESMAVFYHVRIVYMYVYMFALRTPFQCIWICACPEWVMSTGDKGDRYLPQFGLVDATRGASSEDTQLAVLPNMVTRQQVRYQNSQSWEYQHKTIKSHIHTCTCTVEFLLLRHYKIRKP